MVLKSIMLIAIVVAMIGIMVPSSFAETSNFKPFLNEKYNFSFMHPTSTQHLFKNSTEIPMTWSDIRDATLPAIKLWQVSRNLDTDGVFGASYTIQVFSHDSLSEIDSNDLMDKVVANLNRMMLEKCAFYNDCVILKNEQKESRTDGGVMILDLKTQQRTNFENGITQYLTANSRSTVLNSNNDILTIQQIISTTGDIDSHYYEPEFTYMIKSLETQYISKDSLRNTDTIFTAYDETIITPEKPFSNQIEEIVEPIIIPQESEGGGCLIATATYGSEMAIEVQQLREIRDNQLLNTEAGSTFMGTFNDIYYSFSPYIADMERESPLFKEAIKLGLTPMLYSLAIMENAESESEVISLGLSVIAFNLGMYIGIPVFAIMSIRNYSRTSVDRYNSNSALLKK